MAKEMQLEKSIIINQPSQSVFAYLKLTMNQEYFSVWNMTDPNKATTTNGIDGTVGFVYSWDSKNKNVGAGSQKIIGISEGNKIEYEITFLRPMKNIGNSSFTIESINDTQTKVTWDFKCPTKFPMSLFKGMFQKMLGKDISKSLENLKNNLEK
jgi:uncharacterized protein YndB with AHSA1/START domain